MKSPKNKFLVLAFIIPIVSLVVIFTIFSSPNETAVVVLPPPTADGDIGAQNESTQENNVNIVAVNPETVQAVVSTLEREPSYTRTVTVENFWNGGSSATISECFVHNNMAFVQTNGIGEPRNDLIVDNELFVWYENSNDYFKTTLKTSEINLIDNFAHMLTYEELLTAEIDDIHDAGYQNYNGVDCIFAEFSSGNLGYITRVFVAVETGLLHAAERYDGETLVYRMTSTSLNLGEPNAEVFNPPS